MKNILITGGAGFLGSNLCKYLINRKNNIFCLDNLYTGKFENIRELEKKQNFTFIKWDICNKFNPSIKFDQIYNLACPASPPAYQGKHSIETTKTCVIGAINMLELAKQNNATILQSSTSEIYGDPEIHPQFEEYRGNVNPIGIRSCYDEGKRCAESLFFDYWRHEGVNIKVVRIFNTYGPNMDKNDGRVISNFVNQALNGENITIYGNGLQTRSFCYVDDLIKGLVKMMNSSKEIIGPINLGNPSEFTMIDLANLILQKIETKSKIIYKPLPQDDPKKRKPDITKAINLLNWKPEINLSDGLNETIKYFRRLKNE